MTSPLTDPTATPPRATFRSLVGAVDPAFLVLGAASRLPTAMLPLGILLFFAERTGSYATGGLAVAALSVGGGLGGSPVGLLADRFGQRPVVLLTTLVQVCGLGALLLTADGALPVTLALAALVGLVNPQVGAMARARWSVVARDRADRATFTGTSMAWEGAVDEMSFVVGPVVVSTVAGLVDPAVGLVTALVVAALAQTGFALHPTAIPGHAARGSRSTGAQPLPWARLAFVLAAIGSVGLVFGSTSTGVAARMGAVGLDELTGVVYGLLGVGAAVTGLLTTRIPARVPLARRIVAGGAGLVVAGVLMTQAEPPVMLGLACLLTGIALGPVMVSGYALAERLATEGRGTTVMTLLGTANVVGVAVGAAVAGQVVERVSPAAALSLLCVAGVLVVLGGLGSGRRTTA